MPDLRVQREKRACPVCLCQNRFMGSLLKLFWGLARLRHGPEVLPDWPRLLPLILLCWLFTQALAATVQQVMLWPHNMLLHGVQLMVALSLAYALLTLKGFRQRRLRALLALVGVDWLLTLFRLPLLLLGIRLGGIEASPVLAFAFILLLCWEVTARGFIFRRALGTGPVLAISLSLLVLITARTLVMILVPEATRLSGD